MKNKLLDILEKRTLGIHSGIPSFCSANKIVIEAIMDQAKRFDDTVLIEATSNQVNQYGGYMSMTSVDFREYVYKIADQIGFDKEKIILGGDHLGPLPWCNEPAESAMEKAKKLVYDCVKAGYTKVHLDTSMKLGDDPVDEMLENEVIAERGAILYKECDRAYKELLEENPNAVHPVYIIGSEVPIPGGSQEEDDNLKVTNPRDFESTIIAYRKKFDKLGLKDAWNHIIGIVVQPGVEFGNSDIHAYNRIDAKKLCDRLKKYPNIVFEGHSTDYQPPVKLREMVEDGIAIIKVGPALTNAVREAIFALSMIEEELIPDKKQRANFIDVLEKEMLKDNKNWIKHYHGDELSQHIARKYSFSDRSRYYFSNKAVVKAQEKLFENFEDIEIPLPLLHQYMPMQYLKVRDGKLANKARELVKDAVVCVVEDYNYAVKCNYMVNSMI
ncbi:MAG: class II D-tagatose-bisphosphate aldolase, non-catalytic subunit [Oscillospiraceae bacterium]|nr:class II D-tagatose-bisphosphate aldolase, non-catalytic subunit [Candidatus Ruminococcus equi]